MSRLCMILIAIYALPAAAQTQYISDQLQVPLRRGPTNGHKIIHAGLPSGTALEVTGAATDGFTPVRTANGAEGWVPTQYLTSEVPARDRLAAATKRIESLTAELANLRLGIKTEQTARGNAETASTDLNKQVRQLQTELGEIRRVSANAVSLYEENKVLKTQAAELERVKNEQTAQIKSLQKNELQMWMLFGGGLVVLGLILGVIIKSRPKSRGGW